MSVIALELRGVQRRVGAVDIVRGVDLQVKSGERIALIGPNGAGKSSLFNLISGRDTLSSGDIFLNGENISGLAPFQISRKGLARSFQVSNIFSTLSVFDNLRCSVLWSLGVRYTFWKQLSHLHEVRRKAESLCDMLGLHSKQSTPAGELSYAEQRALEIGLTVAGGAKCILLDEPTAGMSRSETGTIIKLIRDLSEAKTLLMVEHDMSVVFELADRIAVMVAGEIVAFDTPDNIRRNSRVNEAYLGAAEQHVSIQDVADIEALEKSESLS
jgi:branched-chain amino acid transport system ATP-binding protein